MAFSPDLDIDPKAEPIFVDALCAVANCPAPDAIEKFHNVQDLTDLHRVEEFIQNFGINEFD